MPKLSIIVPVYKVEKYLNKCIDSILAQTFTDFELILIDDGSPDNCGKICDEYAEKDSRIIVIHQENAGVSAARNAGLDIAKGKYIGFVDSDDWIEPEMYEHMINVAIEKDVQVVVCGFYTIDSLDRVSISKGIDTYDERVLENDELLQITMGVKQKLFHGSVWNKIIKSDLIENNRFNERSSLFEDWFWLLGVLKNCISYYILNEVYCHHLDRDNGLGRTTNADIVFYSLNMEYEIASCYKSNKQVYSRLVERFLDDSSIFLSRIHNCKGYLRYSIKAKMLKLIIVCSIKRILPPVLRNKYLVEGVLKA